MSLESAIALIESVANDRVLFVGDTIQDEYHYVKPLGKSLKEHLIPVEYQSKEVFHGGIEAAANHARTFCATVDIASFGPIIRKVRLIDEIYFRKLFEVHYHGERKAAEPLSLDYDAIVVADFGHGAVTQPLMEAFYRSGRFLALDVQTNASNIGFNLITKYPKADYIVMDEPEARLAAADRDGSLEGIIEKLATGRCERIVVTLGKNGACGYDHGKFYRQSSLSDRVVDTLGAGDAFFSVTAPMAKTGSMEDLLLIGCTAGAIHCGIVGNRNSVTKEEVKKWLGKSQGR